MKKIIPILFLLTSVETSLYAFNSKDTPMSNVEQVTRSQINDAYTQIQSAETKITNYYSSNSNSFTGLTNCAVVNRSNGGTSNVIRYLRNDSSGNIILQFLSSGNDVSPALAGKSMRYNPVAPSPADGTLTFNAYSNITRISTYINTASLSDAEEIPFFNGTNATGVYYKTTAGYFDLPTGAGCTT